jgi:hypothetical protein
MASAAHDIGKYERDEHGKCILSVPGDVCDLFLLRLERKKSSMNWEYRFEAQICG